MAAATHPGFRTTEVSRVGDADAPAAGHPFGAGQPGLLRGHRAARADQHPSGTGTSGSAFSRAGSAATTSSNSPKAASDMRIGGMGGASGGPAK